MNFKEKMMDNMMGKMSPEERKEMMDKMMETFFANMTQDEKQDMMNNMMPKMMEQMMGGGNNASGENPMMKMMSSMMGGGPMMGGPMMGGPMTGAGPMTGGGPMMGGPMMGMMEQMMGSHGDDDSDFHPMDMCREMMSNISKSSDIATFATPEVRQLFEEWVQQVDAEVLAIVKSEKSVSPEKISEKLKISKESVIYFLTRLAQKGKITINADYLAT